MFPISREAFADSKLYLFRLSVAETESAAEPFNANSRDVPENFLLCHPALQTHFYKSKLLLIPFSKPLPAAASWSHEP